MDTTTIIVIIAIIALIGFYLYNRNRPAPRGTYDDKNTRSSGSIGGGTRAHDDPNVRSSGSIGGGTRGYDSPQHSSGGSIGGGPASRPPREERVTTRPELREDDAHQERRTLPNLDIGDRTPARQSQNGSNLRNDSNDDVDRLAQEREARRRKDSEDFRSGGSFGSSSG